MQLRRGIKIAHLRLMAALAATGQVGAAAEAVGITQPAASRLLAEVERMTGAALYARTGRGIALTAEGVALAARSARMLLELELAERELAEMAGGTGGQVRIGAVTGPAMDRVLPALVAARDALPQIQVEVVVATSDVLCAQLLAGRLDFALARLPETGEAARLRFDYIAPEPVCLMARRDHPLMASGPLDPGALMEFEWVMPAPEAILTRTVLARLRALRLPDPPRRVATSSFLFTLAMLQRSDAIAPLASAVAALFAGPEGAAFVVLPVDLGIEVAPFGLLTREGPGLTPAAERVRELVLATLPGSHAGSAESCKTRQYFPKYPESAGEARRGCDQPGVAKPDAYRPLRQASVSEMEHVRTANCLKS